MLHKNEIFLFSWQKLGSFWIKVEMCFSHFSNMNGINKTFGVIVNILL
jgi:hypothetical protein